MASVLVVDDEIGIRELVKEILEDSGYRVTTAATAAEADRRLKADRPDLVLLDLSLPDRDGLSLIRGWAANRGFSRTPVIVLSGFASIDNAVEATRLGAADFLEKPIALQKLLGAVKRATGGQPPQQPAAPPTEIPAWERAAHAEHLPQWPPAAFGLPYREARAEFERAYFMNALAREGGKLLDVAASTGLERTHLYRKIRALGLRGTPKHK